MTSTAWFGSGRERARGRARQVPVCRPPPCFDQMRDTDKVVAGLKRLIKAHVRSVKWSKSESRTKVSRNAESGR